MLAPAGARILFVAGQIGCDQDGRVVSGDFVEQFAQALDHVLAVVRHAGGEPADIVRMTVYVTDRERYLNSARDLGRVWRERLGRHYPAMALVQIVALVEAAAMVEIEATAAIGPNSQRLSGLHQPPTPNP
jgi:enamine deaminase RidA (YjgF/YER057c/UK114 family)